MLATQDSAYRFKNEVLHNFAVGDVRGAALPDAGGPSLPLLLPLINGCIARRLAKPLVSERLWFESIAGRALAGGGWP